jgi:uroporphyrinogen decarboxylase
MKPMSHRQRVQTALAHEEPDVVPLDFGTGGNTSPVPEVYAGLAAHYGLEPDFKLVPHIMRLAQVDEHILSALDIDTRPVYMNPPQKGGRHCDEPGAFYDDWGVKWKEYSAMV